MFGVRREATACCSAAELIEASLDPRDSRADFAAFQFSLLVVKAFVVIMKIKTKTIRMILIITIIIMIIKQ